MYFLETLIVSVSTFLCVLAYLEHRTKIEMAKLGLDENGNELRKNNPT